MAAARQARFDPRTLMEKTIEVMRNSIHERRTDGHANPFVGALLWKADGTIETGCRGELRNGDHAEFTLLERKNRANALDGAVLFTTLEPCTREARKFPKLGCAERIVNARIRRVWVGIEDPDPTVDRKGIKFLQDDGIEVHMFDRDLQDIIRAENQAFIEQALERAKTAAREKPAEIELSSLERADPRTRLDRVSPEALELFRRNAGIEDAIDSPAFHATLEQLGVLKRERDRLVLSGFGQLLFGANPRLVMQQAGVLARIEYPTGESERREFDQPLVLIPDLIERWLRDKLPNVFRRDGMERTEVPALPFHLVREGLINALIHRDYDVAGAKIQLIVDEDTIRIMSPGGPPVPITIEKMQSFSAPTLSRNPILHYVFERIGFAEEQGFGIKAMREIAQRSALPLPRYTWDDPYLVLTLYRRPEAAQVDLRTRDAKLSADEAAAWQFVSTRQSVTRREVMSALSFDARKAQRTLRRLADAGLVRQVGAGPATRFEVVRG